MSTYEEIEKTLSDIHDARLKRFLESGLTVEEFKYIPENIREFNRMIELTRKLVELEAQQNQR